MEAVKRRISFADLQRMPDDGNRYELYDGELVVVPSPMPRHQVVARRLFELLLDYTRNHGGELFFAPFDIVLTDYDVLEPDIIYFGPEKAANIRLDEHVRFPPDLAAEVLSPSTERRDRGRKRDLFARHGLPEYWVVDPRAFRVEASVFAGDRYRTPVVVTSGMYASPAFDGLTVDVSRLFADL